MVGEVLIDDGESRVHKAQSFTRLEARADYIGRMRSDDDEGSFEHNQKARGELVNEEYIYRSCYLRRASVHVTFH